MVGTKEDSFLGLVAPGGEGHDMKHLLARHGEHGRSRAMGCSSIWRGLLDVATVVEARGVVGVRLGSPVAALPLVPMEAAVKLSASICSGLTSHVIQLVPWVGPTFAVRACHEALARDPIVDTLVAYRVHLVASGRGRGVVVITISLRLQTSCLNELAPFLV